MKASTMTHPAFCRVQADKARADAHATQLDNVRERCLRAAEAWDQMAERGERVAEERSVREAASAHAAEMRLSA